nr:MAG TPA: hypothetical protein [Caudoviricetes sp.]
MTTGIQCCYKCPDRHPGCHAKCERYRKEHADYLRRKEIENDRRKKIRNLDIFDRFNYWR